MNRNLTEELTKGRCAPDSAHESDSLYGLWMQAKMECAVKGDAVVECMVEMGLSPKRINGVGYQVEHNGLMLLYVPAKGEGESVRMACPKICLADGDSLANEINEANMAVPGVKFLNPDGNVWEIIECSSADELADRAKMQSVITTLGNGYKIFQKIFQKKSCNHRVTFPPS